MRQLRPMPCPFHLIHQPVVTPAGLQGDLRAWRQVLEKCSEHFSIMPHPNRTPVFAVFVHRHEQRKLLVRITSPGSYCAAHCRSTPVMSGCAVRTFTEYSCAVTEANTFPVALARGAALSAETTMNILATTNQGPTLPPILAGHFTPEVKK